MAPTNTVFRFWAIDGDTYNGDDIDLTFRTEAEARKAYEALKAPYKRLARFGDFQDADGIHQIVVDVDCYYEREFYEEEA